MQYNKTGDAWWKELKNAEDLDKKVHLIKRIASLKESKEFYEELDIGEAIFEYIEPDFEKSNNLEGYCNFLESLRKDFPEIFEDNAEWHVRTLVKYYASKSQSKKLEEALNYLISNPKESPDIIFDLLDVLIINGFTEDAWKLLQYYYTFLSKGTQTIPQGIFELSILSGFFTISNNTDFEKGTYDLEAIKKGFSAVDYTQDEKYLTPRLNILSKKGYKPKEWSEEDFTGDNAPKNLYFFSIEFARQLLEKKGMNPVLAQLFQQYLYEYCIETDIPPTFKFDQDRTDQYMGSLAGGFSLNQTKAFITLCSIKLFYEFLKERKKIDEHAYNKAIEGISYLRDCLYEAFEQTMWKYKFAEKFLGREAISDSNGADGKT